ncbi:hypothetical protein N5853_06190 [Bartonella sp. HY329]|uniref:hypothetical protein n=1 Tax=unclassified Bartonella TaxID=2645622 RepID=UPI0021C856F1|nr:MULTISPECIES: hypothetical protein [unclassified Bartonella]UXM96197.1 hypothetical protein N5853_06190 [Bartonella sp. HY329]UXN10521.1 hypothetical protein N5852_06195 [Bartonella sp. HY328]
MDEKIDYSSNIAYVESIQNLSDEELEKIEEYDPFRQIFIKNNIDYRNQLKKAKALYDANAYARVVVDTIETDNWCQRIEKEVTAEAEKDKRAKIEAFKDAKNFMESNSDWRKGINDSYNMEDFYQAQVRLGKSSKEISDLIDKRINESSIADQYYKLAKEINKPIDLEPFMKKRGILEAWKTCMQCAAQEDEILDRYDKNRDTFSGSEDEAELAEIKQEVANRPNRPIVMEDEYMARWGHDVAVNSRLAELKKKAPELIVDEYTKKVEECSKLDANSSRSLDEQYGEKFVFVMDVCGFIPGLGTASSLILAGYYAAKGELSDAALSMAGAVPLAGAAGKGAAWAVKKAKAGAALLEREATSLARMSHARAAEILSKTPGLTREMRESLLEQAAKRRKLVEEIKEKAKQRQDQLKNEHSAVKGQRDTHTSQKDPSCARCAGN